MFAGLKGADLPDRNHTDKSVRTARAVVRHCHQPLASLLVPAWAVIKGTDEAQSGTRGRTPLKTLNIYVPPAYTKAGDELPSGRKQA